MQAFVNRFLSSDEKHMPSMGIRVSHSCIHSDFPLHTHDFNETFVVVSGAAVHTLGKWAYTLGRGDVFAITGDTAHGFCDVHDLELINLMYKPDFFQQPHSEIRSIPGFDAFFLIEPEIRLLRDYPATLKLNDADLSYVISMADFVLEQQERNREALYPVIRMNFQALMSYLATQYDRNYSESSRVLALSRALAYMEQHLSDPIRLLDIAAHVFLSPRQLERLFLRFYGESPMRYFLKMRLKNALTLLVQHEETVTNAALQSGFEDVSYFCRVFRMNYGLTPSTARKFITKVH